MAVELRRVPPMSFVAQKLRDDRRLAELRLVDERDGRMKSPFSSTAIGVVMMLASYVNRKNFTAWPSLVTLARDCRLNEKSIRRCESAVSIFFRIEGDGRHHTYVFKTPEDYEADLASLMAECNADLVSPMSDRGSKTLDPESTKRTVGPEERTHGPTNSREPVIEREREPENRTPPRGGSVVSTPSGFEDVTETVGKQIPPSMTPLMFEERRALLRKQAADLCQLAN